MSLQRPTQPAQQKPIVRPSNTILGPSGSTGWPEIGQTSLNIPIAEAGLEELAHETRARMGMARSTMTAIERSIGYLLLNAGGSLHRKLPGAVLIQYC
jgi:hypothetical protein